MSSEVSKHLKGHPRESPIGFSSILSKWLELPWKLFIMCNQE
jgi:hypothetical protein